MFQEGNYDVIEFPMPSEGMNQFVSPEVLPAQFAYLLENILPTPLGSGQVRYGTRKIASLNNPEANILEVFPFTAQNGARQAVLYVQYYINDTSAINLSNYGQQIINFKSDNSLKYVKDTPIKITYVVSGATYTLYATIKQVSVDNQDNVQIILGKNFFPNAANILNLDQNKQFIIYQGSLSELCANKFNNDLDAMALEFSKASVVSLSHGVNVNTSNGCVDSLYDRMGEFLTKIKQNNINCKIFGYVPGTADAPDGTGCGYLVPGNMWGGPITNFQNWVDGWTNYPEIDGISIDLVADVYMSTAIRDSVIDYVKNNNLNVMLHCPVYAYNVDFALANASAGDGDYILVEGYGFALGQNFLQEADTINTSITNARNRGIKLAALVTEPYAANVDEVVDLNSLNYLSAFNKFFSNYVNGDVIYYSTGDLGINSKDFIIGMPTQAFQIENVWYSSGAIYTYNFDTSTINGPLKTDLSVACVPRSAFFQQTLLICNGVDRILFWNGTTLQEVVDFVKERQANSFNRIDNQHFSFLKSAGFDATKYFASNLIQLNVDGISSTVTIASVAIVDNLVTITTQENIPAFIGNNRIELFYRDWPPRFNYIFAGPDRLWALGEGAAGIEFRTNDQALRVYYTYEPNTLTNWFNENTKTVPSIDMSDKHGIPDNFEAICQVNGLMAFLGRSKTQVWSGTIPTANGDFQWSSNLPVGTIHGNLLVNMPNDVYFVSQSGLQSFSTLNIAKQFAATSSNAVDPIISKFVSNITSSNIDYRSCRAFKYEQGNLGGFKIGRNKVLASLFQTNFYAWALFSGDFQASQSITDMGISLCLTIGNTLYQYADGNDGSRKLYGDKDGTSLISFVWIPGLISMKGRNGRRFANRRYELIVNYPSEFVANNLNQINIKVNGYIPKTLRVSDKCQFQPKGDILGTAPFGDFRLAKPYEFVNRKLKFLSSSFWVSLSGSVMNGPLSFKKLRLFGIGERHG